MEDRHRSQLHPFRMRIGFFHKVLILICAITVLGTIPGLAIEQESIVALTYRGQCFRYGDTDIPLLGLNLADSSGIKLESVHVSVRDWGADNGIQPEDFDKFSLYEDTDNNGLFDPTSDTLILTSIASVSITPFTLDVDFVLDPARDIPFTDIGEDSGPDFFVAVDMSGDTSLENGDDFSVFIGIRGLEFSDETGNSAIRESDILRLVDEVNDLTTPDQGIIPTPTPILGVNLAAFQRPDEAGVRDKLRRIKVTIEGPDAPGSGVTVLTGSSSFDPLLDFLPLTNGSSKGGLELWRDSGFSNIGNFDQYTDERILLEQDVTITLVDSVNDTWEAEFVLFDGEYLPNNDTTESLPGLYQGDNSNDDYYIVVNLDNRRINPADIMDMFRIRIFPEDITIEPAAYSSRAENSSNYLTVIDDFVDLTAQEQGLPVSSDPLDVIGLNMATGTNDELKKVRVHFTGVGSDSDFTSDDLSNLQQSVASGVAIYRDVENSTFNGQFDDPTNMAIPFPDELVQLTETPNLTVIDSGEFMVDFTLRDGEGVLPRADIAATDTTVPTFAGIGSGGISQITTDPNFSQTDRWEVRCIISTKSVVERIQFIGGGNGFLSGVDTTNIDGPDTWTITYNSTDAFWFVVGDIAGGQAAAFSDTPYANQYIQFTINTGLTDWADGDQFTIFVGLPGNGGTFSVLSERTGFHRNYDITTGEYLSDNGEVRFTITDGDPSDFRVNDVFEFFTVGSEGNGPDFFVVIKGSEFIEFGDDFRVSIAQGDVVLSNDVPVNLNGVTRDISGDIKIESLTDDPVQQIDIPSAPFPIIGINGVSSDNKITSITLTFEDYDQFRLSDLEDLNEDLPTSGVAIYKDVNIPGEFDSQDEFIPLAEITKSEVTTGDSPFGSYSATVTLTPQEFLPFPVDDDHSTYKGADYYIVIRTSRQMDSDDEFEFFLNPGDIQINSLPSRSGLLSYEPNRIVGSYWPRPTVSITDLTVEGQTIDHFTLPPTAMFGINMDSKRTYDQVGLPSHRDELVEEITVTFRDVGGDGDFTPGDLLPLATQPIGTGHFGVELFLDNDKWIFLQEPGTPGVFDADADEQMPPDATFDFGTNPSIEYVTQPTWLSQGNTHTVTIRPRAHVVWTIGTTANSLILGRAGFFPYDIDIDKEPVRFGPSNRDPYLIIRTSSGSIFANSKSILYDPELNLWVASWVYSSPPSPGNVITLEFEYCYRIPYSDAVQEHGDYRGDDFYVVINTDQDLNHGDDFQIELLSGSIQTAVIGTINGEPHQEFGMYTEPEFRSTSNIITASTETVVFMSPEEERDAVDVESEVVSVVGFNMFDSSQEPDFFGNIMPEGGPEEKFTSLTVHIKDINSDSEFIPSDLQPLTGGTESGLAIYRDVNGSDSDGSFDDPHSPNVQVGDELLPIQNPLWVPEEGGYYVVLNLTGAADIPDYDTTTYDPFDPTIIQFEAKGPDFFLVMRTSSTMRYLDDFFVEISTENDDIELTNIPTKNSIQKLFVSNMPTFYEDLVPEGKEVGALSDPEEVIGIDLVNESGAAEVLKSVRIDIMNVGVDTAFTSEDLLELTSFIGDQEFYNEENAGLAIYADAPSDDPTKNGKFDSGDQLVGPLEIDPQRLPEWGENPGAFSTTLKFKDPFVVPMSNQGQNEGNDLFVVIKTSRSISAGDDFTIRIPTESLEFGSGTTVFKSFTTKAITARETSIVTPLLSVLTSPGELIGIASPPKAVIGINMNDQDNLDVFNGVKIDFLDVGVDDDFTITDFAALTIEEDSGVAIYEDSDIGINGIFDETDTLLIPVNPIWIPGEESINLEFVNPSAIPNNDEGINAGDDFFVVIRTSRTIELDDDFIVKIPEAAFDLSAAPFNNIVTSDPITVALSYKLTDLSGDKISANSPPREVIGIDLVNGGDPAVTLSSFRIKLNNVLDFELTDLADLSLDDTSGVTVYVDSADGIDGIFDSNDDVIDIDPPATSGSNTVIITPTNPLFLPDDDEAGNTGDDYYVVIRTGPRAEDQPGATLNDGDTFAVELEEGALTLSRISVPTSLSTQDIAIDSDPPDAPELFINNNQEYTNTREVKIDFTDPKETGVEVLVSELDDFSDRDPDIDWMLLSENDPVDYTITSSGDGEKTIYAMFRDVARNESAIGNDSIILDTTVPGELEFVDGDNQAEFTGKATFKAALDPQEIDSDVKRITMRSGEISEDGTPVFSGSTVTFDYETGESTDLSSEKLTDSNASFGINLAGLLLNPDISQDETFVIVSNTSTEITVATSDGLDLTDVAGIGDTYCICGSEFDLLTDTLNIFEAWAIDFADNSNRYKTGTSTLLEEYALEDSGASFMPNSLIGKRIRPNTARSDSFLIVSNTLTRIQTDSTGESMLNVADPGNPYEINLAAVKTIYQDNTAPQISNTSIVGKNGVEGKLVDGEVGTIRLTATITDNNINIDLIWADLSLLLDNVNADKVPPDSYVDSVATWSGLNLGSSLIPGGTYSIEVFAEDAVGVDHRESTIIEFSVFSEPGIENEIEHSEEGLEVAVIVTIPSSTFDIPYVVSIMSAGGGELQPESDRFVEIENITRDLPFDAIDINDNILLPESYNKNVSLRFEFSGEFNETFRVLVYDPDKQLYVLAPDQTIGNKSITIEDENLGIYAVYDFSTASDLKNVIVYPNPYNPEKAVNGALKFLGVTEDARIRIFDIAGDLVFDGDLINSGPSAGGFNDYVAEWDGRDDDGSLIGSGVYIYRITDDKGNEKIGKFSVERSY